MPTSHIDSFVDELGDEQRAHVASCGPCRARYEEHVALLRALAGAPAQATRAEDEAVVRRVLARSHPAPLAASSPRLRTVAPIGLVAAAACVAVFLVARPGPRPVAPPVLAATVTHAKHALLDGAPVVDGARWHAGQTLVVAKNGLVEVELVRGGTLRVFPGASLALGPRGERVDLGAGKVWALVDKLPSAGQRGAFAVHTSHGSAHVLGTSFLVEAKKDATDVKVVEGRVEVRPVKARAEPVVVAAGERTRVVAGAKASAPHRYDAGDDRDEWQRFFDKLFKAIKQTVDDVIKALDPGR